MNISDQHIFNIDREKAKIEPITEYYTIIGDQDYIDEDNNPRLEKDTEKTLAKKIIGENNKAKFLIKMNSDGKFHNPTNIHSKQKLTSGFLDKKCKSPKFKNVTFSVFNMYMKFLKTKNLSWLYNADREAEWWRD